ncbi:MAG: hypothetical protein IPH62_00755 [Ignavibacteriae bacterium]|nr:hypothetical protein [Ignavibacteriota bacterium]
MLKFLIKIFLFVILLSHFCFSQNLLDSNLVVVENLKFNQISILQLLSNPEKYHNQIVTVSGFLHNKLEDSALYFSKDHADFGIIENSIWLEYSDSLTVHYSNQGDLTLDSQSDIKRLDCRYVELRGRFNKNELGHFDVFPGTIENITEISELLKWYDGDTELFGYDKATGKIVPMNREGN